MAAAVSVTTGHQRFLDGDADLLAQAGQRVIFTQNSNNRTAFAGLAHQRRWQSRDAASNSEPLALKHFSMPRHCAMFLIIELGLRPYAIAQLKKSGTLGIC